MLTALALFLAAPALADDGEAVRANPHARDLTDYAECVDEDGVDHCDGDATDAVDDPPTTGDGRVTGCTRCEHEAAIEAAVEARLGEDEPGHTPALRARYAMHFFPDAPAHAIGLRHTGDRDAYLHGELRYLPGSDLLWTGRAGAGLDLLGGGSWDLTLGVFVGSTGSWDRSEDTRLLYASPMGGGELGFGIEDKRLIAKYRLLAGWGSGPLDDVLTENELTIGYKLTPSLHVLGQWTRLNPGAAEAQGGIGLGVQAMF